MRMGTTTSSCSNNGSQSWFVAHPPISKAETCNRHATRTLGASLWVRYAVDPCLRYEIWTAIAEAMSEREDSTRTACSQQQLDDARRPPSSS